MKEAITRARRDVCAQFTGWNLFMFVLSYQKPCQKGRKGVEVRSASRYQNVQIRTRSYRSKKWAGILLCLIKHTCGARIKCSRGSSRRVIGCNGMHLANWHVLRARVSNW